MLHDISILIRFDEMMSFAIVNNWDLCDAEKKAPFLLHQRVSKYIAENDFSIVDKDILEAIAFHTSLCAQPTKYQMALFIADKLAWSPGGEPPYYQNMLEKAKASLEEACKIYMDYVKKQAPMKFEHDSWKCAVEWFESKY